MALAIGLTLRKDVAMRRLPDPPSGATWFEGAATAKSKGAQTANF